MKPLIDRLADLAAAAEGRKAHASRLLDKANADSKIYSGSRAIGVLARVARHRDAFNAAEEEASTLRGALEALETVFRENAHMQRASDVRAWLDGYLGIRASEWWRNRPAPRVPPCEGISGNGSRCLLPAGHDRDLDEPAAAHQNGAERW